MLLTTVLYVFAPYKSSFDERGGYEPPTMLDKSDLAGEAIYIGAGGFRAFGCHSGARGPDGRLGIFKKASKYVCFEGAMAISPPRGGPRKKWIC